MNITDPIFTDEDKARAFLEAQRWPNGATCPFCGECEPVKSLPAEGSMGKGWYHCKSCRKKFTVRVGTLYERSHVPLNKWLLATFLLTSSKKGMSAHQLHRMLGVTYKTAWFMAHRIREGMRDFNPGPMGGQNKVVEADETYVGGKAKNAKKGKPVPKKEAVFSLVERDGKVRSFHVPSVSRNTLRPILVSQIDRKSYLMTDEAGVYRSPGREFAGHGTVNHSIDEYVRGTFWHTNTIEGYFAILKRGITGVYQHVSQKHLKRYLGEFDFRYNERDLTDTERTIAALKGIEGKRMTYRRTGEWGTA
ncbi:MAG: IS1595 family transposase [Alphaproteobacteria bacterium]|nr:IS1595 family transposase [Alphaproteobacteria bacterium]